MEIPLHYTQAGSGPPLVLLHGNGDSLAYFKYQLEFFSSYYRVIAVDTRGHGNSPRGRAPFTLSQFAQDLNCFLDELGIEKAHILGFSDGGNIALLFALSYPHRVDKLILNGANLSPRGLKPSFRIPVTLDYLWASLRAGKDKDKLAKKELLGLMVTQPHIRPAALRTLSMPVLVLAGTDEMIFSSHTRKIARAIPGAQLAILEGDHFIARRKPDLFNPLVLNFLQGNPMTKQGSE